MPFPYGPFLSTRKELWLAVFNDLTKKYYSMKQNDFKRNCFQVSHIYRKKGQNERKK
jgi:hypothetical protein